MLSHFDKDLGKTIYSHAITNESWIEHSFGFTKRRGQGHLQSMEEYIQSKRSHAMCNLPFSQHIKSKVRDKGYQNLQERGKLNISLNEMREIFQATLERHTPQLTDEEALALKKAFLLSKSVRRQSNSAKWREAAGYQPNLLTKKSNNGKLLKGDLVFYYNIENDLVMYILKEDYQLIGADKKASVSEVGTNCNVEVDVSKLVTDNGLILTVPQELYSVVGDQIDTKICLYHQRSQINQWGKDVLLHTKSLTNVKQY